MIDTSLDERQRMSTVMNLLGKEYSDARTALIFHTPLEILVATILSAQCTDKKVNEVTATLFQKYRTPRDYANADLRKLEKEIKPTGFYHNKARNIKKCCQVLIDRFNGEVPRSMEELLELPGVARKTANIVLFNAYGIIEGIAVDTHVYRLTHRLGFSDKKDPNKMEKDLMDLVPRDKWAKVTDLLISHGRNICTAKKPNCAGCVLNKICPSAFTFN